MQHEYYRNGVVSEDSCLDRPWESASNLCGILKLLETETDRRSASDS